LGVAPQCSVAYVATVATIGAELMGVMSIREFNANVSAVLAKVEAGETVEISRNGKVIVEMRPKRQNRLDDPEVRAARDKLFASLRDDPLNLGGPATYEERTGR
jgi:antitoxin (DNA-binding transcriptional repressor) of toxin-antitoxin stability system